MPSKNLGFGCQVELRNLTYDCDIIGEVKNGTHATKLRLHYVVMNIGKQCPQKTSVFVVRLNCAT